MKYYNFNYGYYSNYSDSETTGSMILTDDMIERYGLDTKLFSRVEVFLGELDGKHSQAYSEASYYITDTPYETDKYGGHFEYWLREIAKKSENFKGDVADLIVEMREFYKNHLESLKKEGTITINVDGNTQTINFKGDFEKLTSAIAQLNER